MACLLYAESIQITDYIRIRIPKVGEIIDNEEIFDDIVRTVISTPYELMVQLDEVGIDFSKINDFDVFCLLYKRLQELDTSMLFDDTDFSGYKPAVNESTGEIVLLNEYTGKMIDRLVHANMCSTIRKLLNMPKNDKMPGNEEARQYMIERAKAKQKRRKRNKRKEVSQMESLIVALVNTEQFKYDYSSVRDISIYQFYSSLKQISHKIRFDNTMTGYYSGSIKFDDISQEDKSWILTTKN